MSARYPRTYRLLMGAGHDPATALEILIDAGRGDGWTLYWIKTLHRNRRSYHQIGHLFGRTGGGFGAVGERLVSPQP